MEVFDYIIIGGGAAGLSTSCLLKTKGQKTLLLEAHQLLGGSASFFSRSHYIFDVGATTLSGIRHHGPLKVFLDSIQLDLPLIKIDPGIVAVLDREESREVNFYSDINKFENELIQKFPNLNSESLKNFISHAHHFEQLAYQAIKNNSLPIRNANDLFKLIKLQNLPFLSLIRLLNRSFYDSLPEDLKKDLNFEAMIDELLFITAQNNSHHTPELFGILGFSYPQDTYYLNGGMKTFFDELKKRAGTIKLNQKVSAIKKVDDLFEVTTNNNTFYAKKIISTLPHKNNLKILKLEDKTTNPNAVKETWSALTLYFTVPNQLNLSSLYYQIHLKEIPIVKTKSFFVSFSHPMDHKRNFNQRLTVTISTHAMPNLFLNLSETEYQKQKSMIGDFILQKFCQQFNLNTDQIENLKIGTPKTFEHFTNRFQGSVGGLGHHINDSLFNKIVKKELSTEFYEIGDTTFPGQGIAAVIYGAQSLVNFLHPKN